MSTLANAVSIGALFLISTLPTVDWFPNVNWHDQQRIGQIIVMAAMLVVASTYLRQRPLPLLDIAKRRVLVTIAAAGLLSTLLARQPLWAVVEVALAIGSLGLAWTVAVTRRTLGPIVDRVLLATLFFTCAGLACRFLASYASAIIDATGQLDAWLLLDGFSNPRFYGQFLTLGLPLLALPLMSKGGLRRYAWVAGTLLVLVWTMAITSGTRGTWLGLACMVAMLSGVGSSGRRWASLQSGAALAGMLIFWIGMTLVPQMLGMDVSNHAASRLTASLSAREVIWKQAWEETVRHPLLGVGPMHLADLPNGIAAHPHQALLQWSAEWGIPSTILVAFLVTCGAWAALGVLRRRRASTREKDVLRLCLTGAIGASLVQSMVDGVLVMPYSQLWLALLSGWLVALHPLQTKSHTLASQVRPVGWIGVMSASVMLLALVVVRDYPVLDKREDAFVSTHGGHYQPRFWTQGVINLRMSQQARVD